MEYQKVKNLLDDPPNQLSKFRIINLVEINDESRAKHVSNQIKFKTSMIKSNLCDYSDAYKTVPKTGTAAVQNNKNKKAIFKNCAPFTNCMSEINNAHVDDAQVVMPMYNLIENSDAYLKTSGLLQI